MIAHALILALAAAGQAPATADPNRGARIDQFEAHLDSVQSATQALSTWCGRLRLADPPAIHAERDTGTDKPADASVRSALGAGSQEVIRYRRVRLRCGDHVLSEADNWYRPALLTDSMNRTLDTTDTPFGTVVRPLAFRRRTIAVERLPASGRYVLRHRAILTTGDGKGFSLVVETYTDDVLRADAP